MKKSTLVRHATVAAISSPVDSSPLTPLVPIAPIAPLSPLRVRFTLWHTMRRDLLDLALDAPGPMSEDALAGWLDRDPGFSDWPIKRPVEMTVEIRSARTCANGDPDVLTLRRRLVGNRAEVTGVRRCGDDLLQDNDVADWQILNGAGRAWTLADLHEATLCVRACYLSFDEIDIQHPPRFHDLQLQFGDADPHVLCFTAAQLASPTIGIDPRPLLHGAFFKTLAIEHTLLLTRDVLATQVARSGRRRGR